MSSGIQVPIGLVENHNCLDTEIYGVAHSAPRSVLSSLDCPRSSCAQTNVFNMSDQMKLTTVCTRIWNTLITLGEDQTNHSKHSVDYNTTVMKSVMIQWVNPFDDPLWASELIRGFTYILLAIACDLCARETNYTRISISPYCGNEYGSRWYTHL